ncbi:MAG: response regulator [Endomicrobiales bacterium]|nr:response regulator [Endomicrobiales bacterium]
MNQNLDKSSIKILVIDDEEGIRNLLSYELGLQGYSVSTAPSGEDGLELIKKNKYQLVITDIKMPKMDGIRVLEATKKIDPEVEVIVITGFGTIGMAVEAIKKGAYDFIQKPFNLEEILSLVEKALEKAELKVLVALYETSKAVFSTIKFEDLLPTLISISLQILKADDVSIILLNNDGEPEIAASHGIEDDYSTKLRLLLAKNILQKLEKTPEKENVFLLGPLEKNPEFAKIDEKKQIKSGLVCPLISKTKITGIVCAARTKNEIPFNFSDQRYANIFASQISQAVENAQLYKELEHKIKALNEAYAKLSTTQKELVQSEKLAAIGQLSAGVAHEINNPLTIVIGLTELQLEDMDLADEKKADLISIKQQAERCRNIILNLMQFAQKNETEKKSVQINELILKTLELYEFNLQKAKISVSKEFSPNLPLTTVNPYQIQQVFLNIFNNAQDALKKTKSPKLSIKTEFKDNKIMAHITDNGCGIPSSRISKIFDPFFTTKEVGKGVGLGLSIAYGIIKEHNGEIRAESKEGEGSTFAVELPVVSE